MTRQSVFLLSWPTQIKQSFSVTNRTGKNRVGCINNAAGSIDIKFKVLVKSSIISRLRECWVGKMDDRCMSWDGSYDIRTLDLGRGVIVMVESYTGHSWTSQIRSRSLLNWMVLVVWMSMVDMRGGCLIMFSMLPLQTIIVRAYPTRYVPTKVIWDTTKQPWRLSNSKDQVDSHHFRLYKELLITFQWVNFNGMWLVKKSEHNIVPCHSTFPLVEVDYHFIVSQC